MEILYPSFTGNPYNTTKKGKKFFMSQEKIKEIFNKGYYYKQIVKVVFTQMSEKSGIKHFGETVVV